MNFDDRLKSRIAGRKYALEILSLGEDDLLLSGPEFTISYWLAIDSEAAMALSRLGVVTNPQPKTAETEKTIKKMIDIITSEQQQRGELPDDVREALEIVDEIYELYHEVPSAAEDFAGEVLDKSRSIAGTIKRSKSVTKPQMEALENMRSGLARWIRD